MADLQIPALLGIVFRRFYNAVSGSENRSVLGIDGQIQAGVAVRTGLIGGGDVDRPGERLEKGGFREVGGSF